MNNNKYWIAFSSIEGIDSRFITDVYNYFGDIEKAFNSSKEEFSQIDGLSKIKLKNFLTAREKLDIDKVNNIVHDRGLKILTYEDKNYPYMLKQISDSPAVLYYKGDFSLCNLNKTLAVVGSRRITRNAQDSLKKVMSGLANTDLCIVSGLAAGADTAAHRFALDNGLNTIGVMGCGFDFIYPTSNKKLYDEIINDRGVVMTEFFPTFEPLPFRFPQRNRIVSGISYGTLVVEAALKSGALITANLTLEQGRELMCIPGLITNPNTEGIYKMLKTGAHLITNSDDILNSMGWTLNKQISLFDAKPNISLTDDEQKIFDFIKNEPKSFDEILKETGINTDTLLMQLTKMELDGLIEQTHADRYKSILN